MVTDGLFMIGSCIIIIIVGYEYIIQKMNLTGGKNYEE